jgi:predicted metalloprotease with PDZ domain
LKPTSLLLAAAAASVLALAAHAQQPTSTPVAESAPANPAAPAPRDVAYPGVVKLAIDATDLDRRIFKIRQQVPVTAPGRLTLYYPQWIPGGHSPEGNIDMVGGLVISAGGKRIPWIRDSADVFAFNVDVPAGVTSLDVEWEYLTPTAPNQGRVVVTPEMLNIQFISTVLYPAGYYARRIPVEATVTLPAGWKFATALETAQTSGATTVFKPVPLDVLVDSPMFAGKNFKTFDLDPGGRSPVRFNVVADEASSLEAKDEQIGLHRNLIVQADKLFGARHFDHYDFLIASTGKLGGIGLEHHRSTEIDVPVKYFEDWANLAPERNVVPHEYVHSWNGKYRRGADLWTPNYNVPMRSSLLWVYEGQTQYWGYVLAARSGLASKEETLGALAATAAAYSTGRPGRTWRNVLDTTNDPTIANRKPIPWVSWQRSEDYYSEGQLVWLDADTLIREKTGGKKSLDDFAKAFFGVNDGAYDELTYTFDDVVRTLNDVYPYDWAGFLKTRIEGNGPAPLDSFARAGYRLEWQDKPTVWGKQSEDITGSRLYTYSLGFTVNRDALLTSILWDGPAFKAGLTVGQTIVAVNGEAYSNDRLKAAITAAKGQGPAVELLMKQGDRYKTVKLDYHDGLRYPMLVKIDPKAKSVLDDLLAAKK